MSFSNMSSSPGSNLGLTLDQVDHNPPTADPDRLSLIQKLHQPFGPETAAGKQQKVLILACLISRAPVHLVRLKVEAWKKTKRGSYMLTKGVCMYIWKYRGCFGTTRSSISEERFEA